MLPGSVVDGRFFVERRAGAGGMGAVYRARDDETGATIALKVLHDHHARGSNRFVREAEILSQIRHPGIVRYVAHGVTSDGQPYLAIEWLEGESLGTRLARGPLGTEETLQLGRRVAEALSEAHRRGIIHRDLKPSNLFLPNGAVERVKLLDFGIARLRDADAALTVTGAMIGTPGYMAPEQARGERELQATADVFALGAVLYHCLTGVAPFRGEDVLAVIMKVVLEDAPRARERAPEVPEAIDDLVARMMAKSPRDRPQDARAVVAELDRVPDLTSAPLPPREPSITNEEQRIMCLALATFEQGTSTTTWPGWPPRPGAREIGLRLIAERHGGTLELVANGSLFVTMTGTGAATDQAARAAHCALALRAMLPGVPMALVTGRGVLESRLPVGEVVDRGVRVLKLPAPPHGVRIDTVTAALLEQRFSLANDANGPVLMSEGSEDESTRTLLRRASPFVGRARELAMIEGIYDQCVADSVARAVVVTGAPGIGKSRLRYELLRKLAARPDAPEIWTGRGDPLATGAPLALLAQPIRRAAGILDGEPLEVRQHKLVAFVARCIPESDAARVTSYLGELVGTKFPDEWAPGLRAARADPARLREETSSAWQTLLAAECNTRPVVIVLEDLHWGDAHSVRLLDAALRDLSEKPWMVLALARPEVHDSFPRLWVGRNVQEVRLGELTRTASEKLVREILGDAVSPNILERVVTQAHGNAFYLEELIRAVANGRGEMLPNTVMAMVEARIAALDAEARRVLRAASAFGQVFWRGGVAALLGGDQRMPDLDAWLDALADNEVITKRLVCKFPGEHEYAYRHALVREAAYSMLTDDDRALAHRLAGGWLESVGESDPVVVAEHFERGGEPSRALAWYDRAAERALESTRRVLGGSQLELATLLLVAGDHAGAEREARAAVATAVANPAARGAALATLANVLRESGRTDEALEIARKGIDLLPAIHDTDSCETVVRLAYAEALRAAGLAESIEALAKARSSVLVRASDIIDPGRRRSFLRDVPENARTLALAREWGLPDDAGGEPGHRLLTPASVAQGSTPSAPATAPGPDPSKKTPRS